MSNKRRKSYKDLQKEYSDVGCQLLSKDGDIKQLSSDVLLWKCSCGNKCEAVHRTFKRWKGLCEMCRKKTNKSKPRKPPSKLYTYIVVKQIFEDANCILVTPPDEFKNTRTKLEWVCFCGDTQHSSFASFKPTNRCRRCGIKLARGNVTYDKFVALLVAEKWKILSPPSAFKNTKSIMKVMAPYGTKTTTTYNRFQQGRQSRKFD